MNIELLEYLNSISVMSSLANYCVLKISKPTDKMVQVTVRERESLILIVNIYSRENDHFDLHVQYSDKIQNFKDINLSIENEGIPLKIKTIGTYLIENISLEQTKKIFTLIDKIIQGCVW